METFSITSRVGCKPAVARSTQESTATPNNFAVAQTRFGTNSPDVEDDDNGMKPAAGSSNNSTLTLRVHPRVVHPTFDYTNTK